MSSVGETALPHPENATGRQSPPDTGSEFTPLLRDVRSQELLAPSVTRRLLADFARQRPAARGRPALRLKALTERETEVLTLVARGRSNAEIAATLVLAEQTVKTHVSRVFTKLDLRDRAQAVVFAYESGLVAPGE